MSHIEQVLSSSKRNKAQYCHMRSQAQTQLLYFKCKFRHWTVDGQSHVFQGSAGCESDLILVMMGLGQTSTLRSGLTSLAKIGLSGL